MPVVIGLIGLLSGFVGTKVMEPVTTKMYEAESETDKQREKQVQPRYSFVVATERMAALAGLRLDQEAANRWGSWVHYALGAGWGLLYVIARAATGWPWIPLGLASGSLMFVLVDEAANWLFGFTAPPDRFPAAAHIRGLVGHLVYGLAVAAFAELLFLLLGLHFG